MGGGPKSRSLVFMYVSPSLFNFVNTKITSSCMYIYLYISALALLEVSFVTQKGGGGGGADHCRRRCGRVSGGEGEQPSDNPSYRRYQLHVLVVTQSAGGGSAEDTPDSTHNHWHHFRWRISQLDKSHVLGLLAIRRFFTPSYPPPPPPPPSPPPPSPSRLISHPSFLSV